MNNKSSQFHLDHLPEYTDKAIINEIKRVVSLIVPEVVTAKQFEKHSRVGMSTVRRHFGTWRQALHAAGLQHLYNDAKFVTDKMKVQRGKGMSDKELLETIQAIAHKLVKETLTIDEFNQHSLINAITVRRRFGGWGKALQQAGLAPSSVQHRYTDEECFENLLAVWIHYGRRPKYHEMPLPPSTISTRAYVNRWGSWRKALHAFVDYVNADETSKDRKVSDSTSNPCSTGNKISSSRARLSDANQRQIKLKLRYKILKRDRFRCVICGRSPATNLGIELHVDHIHPWSKGGKTVPENLRTTCSDCNIGKGSAIEEHQS